jgi:cell division protein FtsW (lipid II flippase)
MSSAASAVTAQSKQHGFRRFWRALKQIFHEVIGGVFAVFAFAWLNAAFRAWTRDTARWLIGLAVAVALLFVFFAVTSFRRARKL